MAFRRPAPVDEVITPNGLVASAARLDLTKKPKGVLQQAWQTEAWGFYDTCGELRFSANWFGNSLSRAILYPADVGDDGKPTAKPTAHPGALAAAFDLLGGPTTQAQILAQVGVHLTVVGDSYVIGETPVDALGEPTGADEWYVASTDELSYSPSGGWEVDRGNGKRTLDPNSTIIIRVWTSHPRKKWEADSPVRAILPVLRELAALVKVAGQQMDSALAGAGLLLLPNNVEFPAPSAEALEQNPDADPLMLMLAESILVPLDDPSDSARLVPPVLRVPPDAVDKIKRITFASELQAANGTMREACIRRLALGLDMPAEVLLGLAQANHWSAWAIEEQAVKLHIAPKLMVVVAAINEGYYVPALERADLDPAKFTLWFDVSQLTQRPNREEHARTVHATGELSNAALLRESGFDEEDAPNLEERVARLLHEVITANPSGAGELVPALVHLWGGGKVTDLNLTAPATDGGPPPPPPAGGDDGVPAEADRSIPGPIPATAPGGDPSPAEAAQRVTARVIARARKAA
jgi:hypothetical protein